LIKKQDGGRAMPGLLHGQYTQSDLVRYRTGTVPMPMGVHIGATWRIWLNRLCVAATRPYVNLLWALVFAL